MNLNELSKEIHQNAVDHGFWDEERDFGEIIALCHSELSEALEEARAGKPMFYFKSYYSPAGYEIYTDMSEWHGEKPEGIAVELADCVIRILDWFGYKNKNLPYSRFYDFSKTESFCRFISGCHVCLARAFEFEYDQDTWDKSMFGCINGIYIWAKQNNLNFDKIIHIKMDYNKTRPYMHGKKF